MKTFEDKLNDFIRRAGLQKSNVSLKEVFDKMRAHGGENAIYNLCLTPEVCRLARRIFPRMRIWKENEIEALGDNFYHDRDMKPLLDRMPIELLRAGGIEARYDFFLYKFVLYAANVRGAHEKEIRCPDCHKIHDDHCKIEHYIAPPSPFSGIMQCCFCDQNFWICDLNDGTYEIQKYEPGA